MDQGWLLNLSAELGCRLMESGAEIYRVEESIRRVLQAYGLESGEVFAIPNCIIVSLSDKDGRPLTRIRRVRSRSTDIDALERYNDVCRRLCAERPPLEEMARRLNQAAAQRRSYPVGAVVAAHFMGAACFCLFFGGTMGDALCGGACGLAVWLCRALMGRREGNTYLTTIACGAVSALLALTLTHWGLGTNADRVIIGALMLLVPGIAMTNAMRDIMAGDTVSGIAKTVDALLTGVFIALGTGAALWLAQLIWR